MRAAVIVLITLLGCFGVTHLLDYQIQKQRGELEALNGRLKAWEATPPARRLAELEETRGRQQKALAMLSETPAFNLGFSLVLASVDGLGANLLEFDYQSNSIGVRSRDPEQALRRLGSIPGVFGLSKAGTDAIGGQFRP